MTGSLIFSDADLADAGKDMEDETRRAATYFKSAESMKIVSIPPRGDLLKGFKHPEPGNQICERRFSQLECDKLKNSMEKAVYNHLLHGVALVVGRFSKTHEPLKGPFTPIGKYTEDEIVVGLRTGCLVTELAVSNHRTYALAKLNDENDAFNANPANAALPRKPEYVMQYVFVEGVPLGLLSTFSASTNSVCASAFPILFVV